jgi:hypothetical protein
MKWSAAIALIFLGTACASSSRTQSTLAAPDSTGLVLLDCRLRFEIQGDPRRFDEHLTTGLERLIQPIPAEKATFSRSDSPRSPVAARPNRGLFLLGPLRPGTYYLDEVGADRDFIETTREAGYEIVRDPVACKLGHGGTSRIAFVVEPGGVTYIGRMTATCDLEYPREEHSRLATMARVTFVADDRTWAVGWDREIHHEIVAWERVNVSLKKTAWREPIERRLEFLRSQPQ